MRVFLPFVLAVSLAGPLAAQPLDPNTAAQQNALWGEQEALRQHTLDLERQAYRDEQQAETERRLSDLAAARARQPVTSSPPVGAPLDARLGAQADALARLQAETLGDPPKAESKARR